MNGSHIPNGLIYLLDLDGEMIHLDNGYWVKFEAKEVRKTPEMPHGLKYSLTLHDSTNTRILGFDNAHAVKSKKRQFQARKLEWDHKHDEDQVSVYSFKDAGQLVEDFWKAVEKILDSR